MKLKNVHYEYRGNDTWRIYFKDYQEAEAFENERTDGKKPAIRPIVSDSYFGIHWYVKAKLTGQFNILRRYVKDPINDYFSNDIWTNLVKKIEGADSDYIFDEIDLWYDATGDKCFFKICCMNGTWTDFFVKNMLNSQFGMVVHANGYYDTDTVGQGGLLLKNITDVSLSGTKAIGCGTLCYYHLYFDDWSNLKYVPNRINRNMFDYFKGAYYIQVVSYNKELPKNISSATLVWDQEENRYSVEDFIIKEDKEKVKKICIPSTGSLWSVTNQSFDRLHALTPPPVPKWVKLDEDIKIGFRQKDMDEVQKEIDEMTKRIYEKLEIKQVKDFDTTTAWYDYLNATETAKLSGADFDGDTVCEYCKRDVDIAEEFIAATLKAKNSTMEPFIVFNNKVMTLAEFNAFIKDTQEKEANNKEEKNMGPKETSLKDLHRRLYWGYINTVKPTKILIQGTATIIWWSDGTKTIVKCQKGDKMDPEKGIAMCVMKKFMGTNEKHSNYLDFAKPAIAEYEKQQAAEKAKKKAEADKRRRAAAKKKGADGNANYKRGTKAETESKEES